MADEDLDQMVEDLEVIIKEMNVQMGRFPKRSEVVAFVWGNDRERTEILEGRFKDDGQQDN